LILPLTGVDGHWNLVCRALFMDWFLQYEREFFKLAKLSAYAACGNCAQYIRCSITFYGVFASYRTCMDCIWIVRIAVERNDDNWRPQGKE